MIFRDKVSLVTTSKHNMPTQFVKDILPGACMAI